MKKKVEYVMIENNTGNPANVGIYWNVIWIALIGGLTAYLNKINNGQKHTWVGFGAELSASALAGYIVHAICVYLNITEGLSGAFIGISGYAGTRALHAIERKLTNMMNAYTIVKNEQPIEEEKDDEPNK